MFKKSLLTVLCLLAVILAPVSVYAQAKKVALVSFYSDKKIGGTGMGTLAESLIKDPSFNLQPLVDKVYDRFTTEFAKDFPFELIGYDEIINTPGYREFETSLVADTNKGISKAMGIQYARAKELVLAYGGPTLLIGDDKLDQCRMLKLFPSADGVMFVSMDYEIEPRAMGFAAGVTCNITISLFDKSCNKVFRIKESAKSSSKVPAIKGIPVMDPKKIQPMCEEATEALFEDLQGRLPKMVKKAGKL
jgi:hypothetical protein